MMRPWIVAVACGYICSLGMALPGEAHAQAFVNQATPPNGRSVYVDQVPPGAKPRAPRPPARARAAQQNNAKTKASVVEEVSSVAQLIPTVGAGSSAVIRSGEAREWPSVGSGTVRR